MKKYSKQHGESGQAMMELTLMLLILTGMILAVVILSGVEISGNAMLLSARNQAQINSRNQFELPVSGDEIASWSTPALRLNQGYIAENSGSFGSSTTLYKSAGNRYKIYSQNSGSLPIPFAYSASPYDNSGIHTLAGANYGLTAEFYSRPREDEFEKFTEWRKLRDFDTQLTGDFTGTVITGNAYNTAALVKGVGNSANAPATLNNNDQHGQHSVSEAVSVMYETFSKIFGIKLDATRMRDHRSNRVYMPKTD